MIAAVAAIFLLSCSQAPSSTDVTSSDVSPLKISYISGDDGAPIAKLVIDGMSCEKMCVSKVKATMAAIPGVEVESMAFDPEVSDDTLTIRYDEKLVDQEIMVKAINEIAGGGVYKVKELQLSKDGSSSETRTEARRKKKSRNQATTHRYSVPNIFDALRKVGL